MADTLGTLSNATGGDPRREDMTRIRDLRPSPAIIVAVVALIAAVGGTALAGQVAITSKISKKKVKKIANKQIDKRLPLGTEDIADGAVNAAKVLNGSLGTAKFSSSMPAVRVTRTTDQSIPFQSNATTTLQFDAERYDTAEMHDDAINNSRLTAPVTGIYAVTVQIAWSNGPGDFRILTVRKNDVANIVRGQVAPHPSTTQPQEVSTEVRLEAGDYVEAEVAHNDGPGADILKQNESSPEFSMTWLAPGP